MRNLIIATLLTGTVASAGYAQLSLTDRMLLHSQQLERIGVMNATSPRKAAPAASENHTTMAFIMIAEGYDADDLRAEGVTVSTVRGDIALATIQTSDVERVAALPCVAKLELSRMRTPMMDKARKSAGVADLHEGVEISQPYTGKGVIVASVDQGLDPNHVNFKNTDGTSRIGYLGHIYIDQKSQSGWSGVRYDRDNIWRFTTDNSTTFHGTHTLGILAGNYRGELLAAVADDDKLSHNETIANPYYGVATGADVAVGCGDLADMLIAENIDQILNYRYQENKPCVLSLSLGSNTGSHNANSLMGQFLDLAAKECIIVIAAGNEGNLPLALKKDLSEGDLEAKTFLLPTYRDDVRYGRIQFYSEKKFNMQAVIFNKKRGAIAYRMAVGDAQEQGVPQYYCSEDYKETSTDVVSPQFSRYFSGYCGVGWDMDPYTGEYTSQIDIYVENNTTDNAEGNYIVGFIVEGEPGQHIECYTDGQFMVFDDYDCEGWDDGSTDGTISDMACGHDVLVVGAYNTRDDYPATDGFVYNYEGRFTPGKVTPFSSWGTLHDGRSLPHVCAPGAAILSSTSMYYVENPDNGVLENGIVAYTIEENRRNYWAPAMGTSMATPFVAGSIALWLEADPYLTIDEIKDIVNKTAVKDADVAEGNPVQWGAGKFNAYEGLKEVLRRSGIKDVAVDESPLMVSRSGDMFTVTLPGAADINAAVYSLSGSKVMAASSACDELTIDASSLAPGVYVLNVNGAHSRKITVK